MEVYRNRSLKSRLIPFLYGYPQKNGIDKRCHSLSIVHIPFPAFAERRKFSVAEILLPSHPFSATFPLIPPFRRTHVMPVFPSHFSAPLTACDAAGRKVINRGGVECSSLDNCVFFPRGVVASFEAVLSQKCRRRAPIRISRLGFSWASGESAKGGVPFCRAVPSPCGIVSPFP